MDDFHADHAAYLILANRTQHSSRIECICSIHKATAPFSDNVNEKVFVEILSHDRHCDDFTAALVLMENNGGFFSIQ